MPQERPLPSQLLHLWNQPANLWRSEKTSAQLPNLGQGHHSWHGHVVCQALRPSVNAFAFSIGGLHESQEICLEGSLGKHGKKKLSQKNLTMVLGLLLTSIISKLRTFNSCLQPPRKNALQTTGPLWKALWSALFRRTRSCRKTKNETKLFNNHATTFLSTAHFLAHYASGFQACSFSVCSSCCGPAPSAQCISLRSRAAVDPTSKKS